MTGPSIRNSVVPKRVQFMLRALRHRHRLRGYDLLYLHSNEAAMAFAQPRIRAALGNPLLVIHQHGATNPLTYATFRWARVASFERLYEHYLRRAHRRADGIIAIDEPCVEKNLGWEIPADRILKLPNAVDTDLFVPGSAADRGTQRQSFGLPAAGPLLVHAGRLEAVKRQGLIIDAVAALRDEWPDLQLAIAGSGSLEARLRDQCAKAGVASRIHFTGPLAGPRLADLFRCADLFVLASQAEGVPMVILEAFATGLPVVSTAVGGVPELVTPLRGCLVPTDSNATALGAAIGQALDRDWPHESIRVAALEFGASVYVARLERWFAELAARRH